MSKTHLPLPRHHIQLRRASIALLDALRREHPTIIAHLTHRGEPNHG